MNSQESDQLTPPPAPSYVPSIENFSYGDHPRQKLDLYKAQSDSPTPVVIYFHGGGFTKGDKSGIQSKSLLKECLEAGFSVVSANYRFINEVTFPAPMNDGARVIQTVRSKALEWGLDAERIASSGGSAGANIALWNAMKGDRSDPHSDDPISRISTAVSAVITSNGQVSKDPEFYRMIQDGHDMQSNILLFLGASSQEELESPEFRKLAQESHTLGFIGPDAPPVFAYFSEQHRFTPVPLAADTAKTLVGHHPINGYLLKKRMDELGRTCIFRHPDDPVRPGERVEFLKAAWGIR
jgi:acetyl esterase/lipase